MRTANRRTRTRRTRRAAARVPTVPATMRVAGIDAFGEPGALTIHTVPLPVPGANEVLIAVHTTGVGRWDPERLARVVDEVDLEVPLGGRFSLDDAALAHERLAGHVLGKIILEIG